MPKISRFDLVQGEGESYILQVAGRRKQFIVLSHDEARELGEILANATYAGSVFEADRKAHEERTRRICADPNTPDSMRFFTCGLCGERVRYDDFGHRHQGI